MGAEWGLLGEVAFCAQRAIHLVGGNLMEALARLPCRITLAVASGDPRTAGGVEQVLRAQDVHTQEELRVFDRAVHMALGGKVYHIVYIVFAEESVGELPVAYVALDKEATMVVDVVFDGAEVAGIGEGIEHHHAYVVVGILLIE